MIDKPPEVEILLKDEHTPPPRPKMAAATGGYGRFIAIGLLAFLYLMLFNVFQQSFEPRVEWVDSNGRTMLEERPVFWPLIVFAIFGRFAAAMVAWFPAFMDPTKGLLRVPDSPELQKRRLLFRVLYVGGLVLATWTLFNNLAFADILGILRAVALVGLILVGVAFLFRVALLSILSRMSANVRRPPYQ
ncbi:MAG: hypothetical protein AB8G16_10645 [Gammaproteobacteria bacterium]